MNVSRILSLTPLAAVLILGTASAAAGQDTTTVRTDTARMEAAATPSTTELVEVASEASQFSTLERAIQAAGLEETLSQGGPYTIMAPTDEAFARLPASTREALFNDPERLRDVILYHVVPGRVMAAEAVTLSEAPTVGGGTLRLRTSGGDLLVNNATVQQTDIESGYGVIHGIDTVLMPPEAMRK